ncbi:MAG: hypothetical protein NC308_05955 [Clostridium sp.]|nr:hypothetical protein [Bacteroides sp.]MCM1198413.1 hypothetical protein [Clostridium sp.]
MSVLLFFCVLFVIANIAISIVVFYRYNCFKKELDKEFDSNPYCSEPNDDGANLSLTTFNGFGKTFSGKFRKITIEGQLSYVTYHCTTLLFFIIPGKCYRVIPKKSNSFIVIGSETPDSREIKCVKLLFYGIWSVGLIFFEIMFLYIFLSL